MAQGKSRTDRPLAPGPWANVLARIPAAALLVGVVCLLALAASGLGHRAEMWHFRTGFVILRWAVYGAVLAAVLGLLGAAINRPGTGRPGFWVAVVALLIGAGTFGYPYAQYRKVLSVPFIHDITTDTANPPAFVAVAPLRAGHENPPEYDGEEVARQQLEAYPELGPARYVQPPEEVFPVALDAAEAMGWDLVAVEKSEGRIEATDTTFWYGFKDDVVIRVAGEGGGTIVDLRSKSRDGRSDLGVNAARIGDYLVELAHRMRK